MSKRWEKHKYVRYEALNHIQFSTIQIIIFTLDWIVSLGPESFGPDNLYQYSIITNEGGRSLFVLARDPEIFYQEYDDEVRAPRPKWSVPAVPCSVHCSYTAAYAVYLQYRLLIHC